MVAVDGIVEVHLLLCQIGGVFNIGQRNRRLVGNFLQREHLHFKLVVLPVEADLAAGVLVIPPADLGELVLLAPCERGRCGLDVQVDRPVVAELDDVVGLAHLADLAVDASEGVEGVRDGDDGPAAALVDLDEALALGVERQVHFLRHHQGLVLGEVVQAGGVDEGQEDVLAAQHAELVGSGEGGRRPAD